jgi:hypothetical protein
MQSRGKRLQRDDTIFEKNLSESDKGNLVKVTIQDQSEKAFANLADNLTQKSLN